MSANQSSQILRDYYAAWCTGDPDAIAEFFVADGVFEDLAFGVQFEGLGGVRTFARITYAGVPDFMITPQDIVVDGNRAAASWIMSGTHAGDLPGYPATKKQFEIRASSIVLLRDDKILRMTDYWNPKMLG